MTNEKRTQQRKTMDQSNAGTGTEMGTGKTGGADSSDLQSSQMGEKIHRWNPEASGHGLRAKTSPGREHGAIEAEPGP